MAVRPVFSVSSDDRFFVREDIEFQWFSGFALSQKRKCINSLHSAYLAKRANKNILEISSKSENELGVKLSAFNLMMHLNGKTFSVESAFQAGKIFEAGGPYTDLLDKPSIAAKRDDRLKNSGRIVGFTFNSKDFAINPPTYFYNWLYINALNENENLTEQIIKYDAFTDIAFNPQKSLNCQAAAAALYVSLKRHNLLDKALTNKDEFLKIISR
ncbi:MAG: hypothetical protein IJ563_10790 [Selenomonadaceae bacterium]|nr:hypothetical protein [Selenomonadaceae bacterium]